MEETLKSKVDLFKILLSVWRNKFIFLAVTIACTIISIYIINSLKPTFGYKIYYTLNITDNDHESIGCYYKYNSSCRANLTFNELHINYLPLDYYSNFDLQFNTITYKGFDKNNLIKTYDLIKAANIDMTKKLKKESNDLRYTVKKREMEIIRKNLNLLNNGTLIFNFSEPKLIEYPKLSNFIILLLLLFGPLFALFIIFIKVNIKKEFLKN